ncbi:hypothetical protein PROFUN_02278 [Planoprotostelium fungivorum]|uniref:Choline monooxygenase, chloroplastic n=1 Tax=Planoprotostelium fungivorum TaxID=1890364 RepID=A0A2P6NYH3_9EUKA|nr:hypothetical protein PROFUN_02278 [Planoprotostelium fungivorum]
MLLRGVNRFKIYGVYVPKRPGKKNELARTLTSYSQHLTVSQARHQPTPRRTYILQVPSTMAISKTKSDHFAWDKDKPLEFADTLPSSFYTDPSNFENEMKHVFTKNWLFAAHIQNLKNIGDYVTGRYGRHPWLLVRDEDNRLKAFYNVCMHHAMTVTPSPSGNTREFVCNYHGWRYALNGRLRAAVGVKGIKEFSASKISLATIETKEVGPFVFLRFDKEDVADANHLMAAHEELSGTSYDGLEFVHGRDYPMRCNWKPQVFVDNYLDGGMHVKYAHPDLASDLDLSSYSLEVFDRYSVQRAAAKEGERVKGRAQYIYLYPNLMINRYGDWMDINIVTPTGVDSCVVKMEYYLRSEKKGEAEWIEKSLAASHKVQEEDVWLCEGVQRGLESPAYDVGRYAPSFEKGMYDFHKTLYRQLNE